jgi:hypothetical protein
MRLPRICFTIRHLLILVAFVALGGGVMVEGERRRARFRGVAAKHQEEAERYFILLGGGDSEYQRKLLRLWEETYMPIVAYHAKLRDKYEWAARFPWLPVASDTPAPPAPPWPPTDLPSPD